jgi:hypothetical protein
MFLKIAVDLQSAECNISSLEPDSIILEIMDPDSQKINAMPWALSRRRYANISVLQFRDVYPGSEFLHPASLIQSQKYLGSGSSSKSLKILALKLFLRSRKNGLGCSSRISDPDFLPSRIQGSKKHRIRIHNTGLCLTFLNK